MSDTNISLSQDPQTNSSGYKFTLLMFALLGYVVIFGVLLSLVGIVAGIVWLSFKSIGFLILLLKKKLIFILLPLIWVLARALWVKIDPPQGYPLTRKEYPQLFDEIDELTQKLKTPKLHEIILTSEFNAAVTQVPRLGILGWHKNYLILGLELLLVLSPNQARAVIAHELGHLSGNHSRFNGWIYRARESWYRIMVAFHQQNNFGANLMRRFFDWYYPRFNNYSFALARRNEYEADAISVELTSQQETADALINAYVSVPYVDSHYWKNYFKLADFSPQPNALPWDGLSRFLNKNTDTKGELQQHFTRELESKTSDEDTHPSLNDRLKALGIVEPDLPQPTTESAAQVWFGSSYQTTLADFDKDWLSANKEPWKERYQYASKAKQTLKALNSQNDLELSDEGLWEKAILTEEFESEDEAVPLFRLFQERHPQNPEAAFVLGRLTYEQEGDELLRQMKIALQQENLIVDACQYAYFYLQQRSRQEEAEWWRDTANVQLDKQYEDEQDRSQLTVSDEIVKHSLDEKMVNHLAEKLSAIPKVKKAWLAQKVTKHYPEYPAIAIAIQVKNDWFTDYNKLSEEIVGSLQLNHTIYIVPLGGDYKKLAKKIRRVGNSIKI